MNYAFDLDLKDGLEGESHLADILKNKKIEVKTDYGVGDTGNLVVEYASRGKKSGISTTQADYWAFVFAGDYSKDIIVMVKTERLKNLLSKDRFKIVTGGDKGTSKLYLIPKEELLSKE